MNDQPMNPLEVQPLNPQAMEIQDAIAAIANPEPVEPLIQAVEPVNPYNAPQEHWQFPESVTGVGPVTAITSARETEIHSPEEDLTIRVKEPYGDILILDQMVRDQYAQPTPIRLQPDNELKRQFGDLNNQELARIRTADGKEKSQELLTLLSQGRSAGPLP